MHSGFDSWSHCGNYSEQCDIDGCIGCPVAQQKDEAFPIFPALLNAVHQRGIKVRLMTNNYTQKTCSGSITPLDWFFLNNIEIRFYTSTTLMHAKVVIVDNGRLTSISSVNFNKTSFTENREAGVVIEDCDCPAMELYRNVFQHDWDNGLYYVIDASYSEKDLAVIKNTDEMTVPHTTIPTIEGAYVTKKSTFEGVTVTTGYTSPDGALEVIMSDLTSVKSSLQVKILFDLRIHGLHSVTQLYCTWCKS